MKEKFERTTIILAKVDGKKTLTLGWMHIDLNETNKCQILKHLPLMILRECPYRDSA